MNESFGAGVGRTRLDADVDDARGAQAVLRRQGAGEQRKRVGEPGRQDLAEQGQPFRQLNAVEPVLQAAVVAAHMDLAEAVLHHAGRAQQHLVQRRVLALRGVLDGGAAEVVLGGAEARQDRAALLVHLGRRDGDARQRRRWGLRRGLRLCRRRGHAGEQAADRYQTTHAPHRPLSPLPLGQRVKCYSVTSMRGQPIAPNAT